MVHYRKQLWGVFHYVVLSVLQEHMVGHIASGRLHVTENVFPDVLTLAGKASSRIVVHRITGITEVDWVMGSVYI